MIRFVQQQHLAALTVTGDGIAHLLKLDWVPVGEELVEIGVPQHRLAIHLHRDFHPRSIRLWRIKGCHSQWRLGDTTFLFRLLLLSVPCHVLLLIHARIFYSNSWNRKCLQPFIHLLVPAVFLDLPTATITIRSTDTGVNEVLT